MTRRQLGVVLGAVGLALLVAVGLGLAHRGAAVVPPAGAAAVAGTGTPRSNLSTMSVTALPVQARDTLALIDRGGPFPYKQDNTIFSNTERVLPLRPPGYYREYTVPTPGSPDRGTRRLVVGTGGDVFYTDDHYATFRQVLR